MSFVPWGWRARLSPATNCALPPHLQGPSWHQAIVASFWKRLSPQRSQLRGQLARMKPWLRAHSPALAQSGQRELLSLHSMVPAAATPASAPAALGCAEVPAVPRAARCLRSFSSCSAVGFESAATGRVSDGFGVHSAVEACPHRLHERRHSACMYLRLRSHSPALVHALQFSERSSHGAAAAAAAALAGDCTSSMNRFSGSWPSPPSPGCPQRLQLFLQWARMKPGFRVHSPCFAHAAHSSVGLRSTQPFLPYFSKS